MYARKGVWRYRLTHRHVSCATKGNGLQRTSPLSEWTGSGSGTRATVISGVNNYREYQCYKKELNAQGTVVLVSYSVPLQEGLM